MVQVVSTPPNRKLLPEQLTPTIFHEPWWLSIAGNGRYREVSVSSGGTLVGRLPFVETRVGPQTVLGMPMLTHVLGPAVLMVGSASTRLHREIAVTSDLISQLPKAAHISFRLHGGTLNTLAFDMAGYINAVQFTVEIEPQPADALWKGMRDKTRNVIRRAEERLQVQTAMPADHFLDFYEFNLGQRGSRNNYNREACRALIEESVGRAVGRVLTAHDGEGHEQAAIFTVWDHRTEYYFMSTRASASMSGATSLLIWKAIQHASQTRRVFDMDGVHVSEGGAPNLNLVTGFGGKLVPRFVVRRPTALSSSLRLLNRLRKTVWRR